MGQGLAPCSGYVLKITEEMLNNKEINITGIETFEYLEDQARDLVSVTVTIGKDTFEGDLFLYDKENGDIYDDLKDGDVCLIVSETDLYEKKLTTLGESLKKQGKLPELKSWTNFG